MGRLTSIALAIAPVSQAGCGIAERAGRGATQGAIGTLAKKVPDREGMKQLAEDIKRRAARGFVNELSQPEPDRRPRRRHPARRRPSAARHRRRRGRSPGRGAVEAIGLGRAAFSRQMVDALGPAGEGPLGRSLSATAGKMSGAMTRGVGGELGPLFPECRGADASKCVELAVERLSRASAAGLAAGVRAWLGPWPLVLAFAAGALFALLVAWASTLRRARPRREPLRVPASAARLPLRTRHAPSTRPPRRGAVLRRPPAPPPARAP